MSVLTELKVSGIKANQKFQESFATRILLFKLSESTASRYQEYIEVSCQFCRRNKLEFDSH